MPQRARGKRASVPRPTAICLAALAYIAANPSLSYANCTTSNNTTTCDSSAPSPWTSTIGTGPATVSGSTVTVGTNAQIAVGDITAIALADNATIVVQSGAQVTNIAQSGNGTYGTGANTIDFRNNSTLTVEQGAAVISGGTQGSAEAVNPEGTGNTIVNNGTIQGVRSAAIWFQNTTGSNTVINNATGLIEAPANVMGASGNGAVDFTNRGRVIGNLVFAGGNDALHLYTGSSVSGSINGGGGSNLVTLNGTGTGTLPTGITNFQTLQKQDSGTWTIGSSLRTMGITSTEVQQGTLALTGDNTQYTGTMLVDQEGVLQGSSQSLPGAITDNGLVRFAQTSDGSYAGVVSGTGSVEKNGAGTLTLGGGNSYTGGTVLRQGVLSVSADSALGGTAGGVTFDGGTLQLGSSFGLASTRALSVAAGGGTIDTQSFQSTISQDVTGAGSLFKTGSGTLTIDGSLVGAIAAEVRQGTLVLNGSGAQHTGSVTVDQSAILQASAQSLPSTVINNGLTQFQQNVDGTYAGLISGSGVVEKDGLGTLTLAPGGAGNTYTGGTVLKQGVLSVSADNALGGATGGVSFNGGTLQLGSSFDLANTRAISIDASGGTIDTQAFHSTVAQNISGVGALTKLGSGTLVLNGANTWSGGTTVSSGTLAVGDASASVASITGHTSVSSGATLGGYGTVNGDVTNNGTIAVADALAQFAGGAQGIATANRTIAVAHASAQFAGGVHGSFTINGTLTNANLVQLGGGQSAGNTLVVNNYVGNNGTLALNTVLASDNSASDTLVVNGGTATGTSTLKVTNVGGQGAAITSNGIQVVAATNGAMTDADAFSLAGGTMKAGAYEYYLAKGGVTSGTSQNWYLRNTLVAAQSTPDDPNGSGAVAASPTPAAGTPALPAAGPDPVPLYRPEVALYAELPAVARQLGMMQIDNFHSRHGEQSLLNETGTLPATWGRVWGGHTTLSQSGDVAPGFSGSMMGTQVGQDVYARTTANGQRDHYGLFLGFGRATGDVSGFAVGVPDSAAGHLGISAYSVGGYWTHVGPGGWYTDAVVAGSSLVVDSSSRDGVKATTHGNAVTGSLEGGLPFAIGHSLTLEPQAQLIWQRQTIKDLNDGVSNVTFSNGNTMVGRLGVRLSGVYDAARVTWQPYVRFNVLRSFGGSHTTTFDGATPISTSVGQTTGQIDAGLVAKLTKHGSAFATVSVGTNLGGEHQRVVSGNVGARWTW
ncbi:autotransporter outer membrane beta-barrel domain-containing protein [Paraburkholderia rhynchosiae]|nr:autotransporter outer membrane beta-barrel domain-containing protein [Paraburkholderia rhynchosiae]